MSDPRGDFARLVELGRQVDNCERHGSDWCSCKVRQYLDILQGALSGGGEPERPHVGGQPGRLDVDGVEWWACDPYPTWYRYEDDGTLTEREDDDDSAAWADESHVDDYVQALENECARANALIGVLRLAAKGQVVAAPDYSLYRQYRDSRERRFDAQEASPLRCPTCDGDGPDRVDEDFTSGGLEMECGDDWHDTAECVRAALRNGTVDPRERTLELRAVIERLREALRAAGLAPGVVDAIARGEPPRPCPAGHGDQCCGYPAACEP